MKYLLILLFPIACFADTQAELIETIEFRCDFYNEKIPLDIRESCMVDYVNSAVYGRGDIDLKKADDKRLKEAKRRREEDANIQN